MGLQNIHGPEAKPNLTVVRGFNVFTAGICLIDRQKLLVDSMSSFLAQLGKARDSYALIYDNNIIF